MSHFWREQSVLITGASSGIGFSCAEAMVSQGVKNLLITGRSKPNLDLACAQLASNSPAPLQITGHRCDHSNKEDIDHLIDFLNQDENSPQVVIANVGLNLSHELGPKKIQNTQYDDFLKVMNTNVLNTFHLLSSILKAMKKNRQGRIILIGSQAYQHGIAGQVAYNVSKAALVGLKNSIVSEYARNGIYCHLLNPGLVLNERTLRLRASKPALESVHGVTETDVANKIIELVHLNEPGKNGQEVNI